MTLDFALARSKHLDWRMKLRSFLEGHHSLTETEAISHRDCELGKWLYSEGLEKYGQIHTMQALEETHVELHAIVKRILQQKRAGNDSVAQQEFRKLGPVSDRIIELLKDVEQICDGPTKTTAPSNT